MTADTPWQAIQLQSPLNASDGPPFCARAMSNQACAAWPIPPKLAERDSEILSLLSAPIGPQKPDTVKPTSERDSFFSPRVPRGEREFGERKKNRMQQELPISSLLKRSLSAYSIRAPTEGEKSQQFDKIHHRLALTLVSLAKGLERINLICSKSFALRLPFPLQAPIPDCPELPLVQIPCWPCAHEWPSVTVQVASGKHN